MKIKRLISLILVMIIMATSLTTNVFALEGCDGVLDTGEIELESYIQWNTFKSKIDGVDKSILDEIRSAESRGVLPELFPVGDDQFVVKTDLGFYSFMLSEDGIYKSTSKPIHFARFGGTSSSNKTAYYVGTGTPTAGEVYSYDIRGLWCCSITGISDYGYHNGNFFILATAQSHSNIYGNDNKHGDHHLSNIVSEYEYSSTYMLFVVKPNSGLGIQEAMHGYNNNWSSSDCWSVSVTPYWGNDKFYLVHKQSEGSWRRDWTDNYIIQEYDLNTAPIYTSPSAALALKYTSCGHTLNSIGGTFATLNNLPGITLDRGPSYPTGTVWSIRYPRQNYGSNDEQQFLSANVPYNKDDSGVRVHKPIAGIIDQSMMSGTQPVENMLPKNYIASTAISSEQQSQLLGKLAARSREYGIPFYGSIRRYYYSSDYCNVNVLDLKSSRGTQIRDSKTYHDGQKYLYRRYSPKLGADGKYILGQQTVHMIGAGVSENATQLVFDNLSLGSDAKIEIYGVPITVTGSYKTFGTNTNLVLLETITSAKNSSGSYTTPVYNYGEIKVEFTGGSSTSGRGEGYVISDIKTGRYGDDTSKNTVTGVASVSCPHISYKDNGIINAPIPVGRKLTSKTTVQINSTTCPGYSFYKVASNVPIVKNQSISIPSTYSSSSSYNAYMAGIQVQIRNVGSATALQTLNCVNATPSYVTPTVESGNYDIYVYHGNYSSTYYTYSMSFGTDTYESESMTHSKSITYDNFEDPFEGFNVKSTFTLKKSNLKATPSSNTTDFNKTITLNRGDTVRIRKVVDHNYTHSNSQLQFRDPAATTTQYYQYPLSQAADMTLANGLINGNYTQDVSYVYSGVDNKTIQLVLYDCSYNNTTYQFDTDDYFEVTIYSGKKVADINYSGSQLKSLCTSYSTKYLLSNLSTTESYTGYKGCLLQEFKMVPSGYNGYSCFYNGYTSYNMRSAYDFCTVMGSSYNDSPYIYTYNDGTTFTDTSSMRYRAWDNPVNKYYGNIYARKYIKVMDYYITPNTKSGYLPAITTMSIDLTNNSTYCYYQLAIDGVTKFKDRYAYNGYNDTYSENLVYESGQTRKHIELYAMVYSNNTSYMLSNVGASLSGTTYYYDTAGTKINRYTVNGTKTWNHTITASDGDFSRLKISNVNIPSAFTVTVNGTPITGNKDFGWLNTNTYDVVITTTGDGVHGTFLSPSIEDMFTYTLDTKSLYDKSKYTVNSTVNKGRVDTTWTQTQTPVYNRYGNVTSYQTTVTPTITADAYSITNVSNAYVRIISNITTDTIYYDSRGPSCVMTASGLRGTTGRTVTGYYYSGYPYFAGGTGVDWGWVPTTSSTVTITPTVNTHVYNYNNSTYRGGAKGYTVQSYQVIKATDIPDDKIKSYSTGYNTIISATQNYIDKATLDKFKDYDTVGIQTFSGSVTNGYDYNNYYYVAASIGGGKMLDASGNVLSTLSGNQTMKIPSNADKLTYNDTVTFSAGSQGSTSYVTGAKCTVTYGPTGYIKLVSAYNTFEACGSIRITHTETYASTADRSVASNTNYQKVLENNIGGFDGQFKFNVETMAGKHEFDDGRFGVPRVVLETYSGNTAYNRLQRVDVYRRSADGKLNNLAVIPVTGTSSWYRVFEAFSNNPDDAPCVIYHIGNDLLYAGAKELVSNTNGSDGKSLAWLRTGHWHLKGSPDDIEGITQGGINNPVKTMETDDADTEIVVNELDMNAKSWQMGHNIKDGKVTDQKLSDDVKKELREINLGTVTFIKGDGEQYKYVPVGTYGVDADTLDGTRLKYGTRYVDIYAYDDNQVEIEVLTSMIGNKNINGSTSGSLSTGEHIFTGNVTVDGVSVPVVLQVNVINRPTTSGKTTITLTD